MLFFATSKSSSHDQQIVSASEVFLFQPVSFRSHTMTKREWVGTFFFARQYHSDDKQDVSDTSVPCQAASSHLNDQQVVSDTLQLLGNLMISHLHD